jgi:hypothetical protein
VVPRPASRRVAELLGYLGFVPVTPGTLAGIHPERTLAGAHPGRGVVLTALAYGLDIIPLAAERFDLVIPADRSREAQVLVKVLSSRWLLDQLASLPGYDPARCGELIATLPPPRPPLSPSLEPVP